MSKADFIAVDLGASSGRVLLGQWDGERFSLSELHRFTNGPVDVLGRLHWDILRLWEEIKTGLRVYAKEHGDRPAGIGIDTWGVDFVLSDKEGTLLGNPFHYRDKRTVGGVERLDALAGKERIYETTGIQFLELNTLTQLVSMVEARSPQLDTADTLLMMPDVFNYWLTGIKKTEYTNASTTQMLGAQSRAWDLSLLKDLGIPTHFLPNIVQPGTVLGSLDASVADEVGLHPDTPVVAPGTHDTASAVAAVPHLDEKSVYLSSGTWSLMGVEVAEPIINDEMLRLNFTNEGGVGGTIRLLKNVAGMWLLEESRRQWAREGQELGWSTLLDKARNAVPFQSIIDPDDASFNVPGNLPSAIRAYCQKTNQASPSSMGAVARCCLESLALKYRWVVEATERLTRQTVDTVRIVGGGSQNDLLNQFTADACGKRVVAGPVEATALGNIMMQAVAIGHIGNIKEGREAVARSVDLKHFEPKLQGAWDEAFGKFIKFSNLG